jgi:hypothetical protein
VADRSKTCAAPTAQRRLPLVGSAGSSVGPARFFVVPRTKRASGGRSSLRVREKWRPGG